MKRKISAAVMASFLILGLATPVSAATSGGACSTAGATAKIGNSNYICAKNPFFNTAKLTWVWDGCIELNTDYQAGIREAQTLLRASEANRFQQIEPIGTTLKDLIKWNALITYARGNIVHYGSTYYSATKASTNKAPTAANIGSTKFWVVSQPTNANARIGQMPSPTVVLATATRQITALTAASVRSTVPATKLKLNNLAAELTTKRAALEANQAPIQGVIDSLDPLLTELKSAVALVSITRGLIKDKCNPRY
jgi:subtilisin family serine protease